MSLEPLEWLSSIPCQLTEDIPPQPTPHGCHSSPGRPSLPTQCWMVPTRREASYSRSFGTGGETLEPPSPKSQENGRGLVSASGGRSTSIGSSSPQSNGAEGATPLRESAMHPAKYTGTICIPEVMAAVLESLPPPRHLADPQTHLPLHL